MSNSSSSSNNNNVDSGSGGGGGILSYCNLNYLVRSLYGLMGTSSSTSNTTSESIGKENQQKFPDDWNSLFISCFEDDIENIEVLISNGTISNFLSLVDRNKWNALHIAVSKNNTQIVTRLLPFPEIKSNINLQNDKGYTALHIASCNGFNEIVQSLLSTSNINLDLQSDNLETCLYLACSNQHYQIARDLLAYKKNNTDSGGDTIEEYVNKYTIQGNTPLHTAIVRKNLDITSLLLSHGADVNAFKKDGSTPLHIAAILNFLPGLRLLLDHNANCLTTNRYGNTPLHEACIKGNLDIVKELIQFNKELIKIKDKDGSTPLHISCNIGHVQESFTKYLDIVKELVESGGANVNEMDEGLATPLHIASCVGDKGLDIIKYLLEKGSDPTIENYSGLTPLHHLAESKGEAYKYLMKWFESNNPEFLKSFDEGKPKKPRERPVQQAAETGVERLTRIVKDIEDGKIKKIIVLTGAGISVNAGIPAYRTEDGIYNLEKQQFGFSMETLLEHPDSFYHGIKKYFYPVHTGKILPTKTHNFITKLGEKGILLRNYTQNVDSLQEKSGISSDLIVNCHGSLSTWRCTSCLIAANSESVWNEIGSGALPMCTERKCREIIRPDVTFFGEGLPKEFNQYSIVDFRKCDLLIVLGTSLTVYPFAGLLNDVGQTVPRILINKNSVGPFRSISDISSEKSQENNNGELFVEARGSRDTVILGDCDKGVTYFENLFTQNYF
eukprot:gene10937-13396_t